MKNYKKVLLCITVSVAITTFVAMITNIIINRFFIKPYLINSQEMKDYSYNMANNTIMELKNQKESKIIYNNKDDEWELPTSNHNSNTTKQDNIYNNEIISKQDYALYGKEALARYIQMSIFTIYQSQINIYNLYLSSALMGVLTGVLVYLIFIKKIKAKKIIFISLLSFSIIYLILNIKDIISDIVYSIRNKYFGLNFGNYILSDLNIFFVVYLVIFIIVYSVNLIHQRRIVKKLNCQL